MPVAIFAGKNDELAVPKDCKRIKKELDRVEHYEEMHGDHMTFFIAEDASFFTERAMNILKKHQPIDINQGIRSSVLRLESSSDDFLQ